MRLILLFFLSVFFSLKASAQRDSSLQSGLAEQTVYFSDAIKAHLKKYNIKSDIEYEKGDIAKGQALFDSLVQNYLVGSKFNDFSLKSIGSRKIKLSKIKKPVFIITYASWCVINKGEIAALNKLSRKYSKDMQFIVLFWDKKSEAKKYGRRFNGSIDVCYANESYRNDAKIVSTLKHTLGFPTSYFLNGKLEVIDIKRGGVQTDPRMPLREAIALNYNLFNERLGGFLSRKDAVKEQFATSEE